MAARVNVLRVLYDTHLIVVAPYAFLNITATARCLLNVGSVPQSGLVQTLK